MDEIAAEHPHGLLPEIPIELRRELRGEHRINQARRGLALGVHHQLHQQHALVEHHRRGHSDSRGVKLAERLGLRGLPGLLFGLLAKAAALLHRSAGAAVADEPPLLVARVVLEVALGALLVDLRRHVLAAVRGNVDVRLFTALEAGDDLINHAIGEEDFKRCVHRKPLCTTWTLFLMLPPGSLYSLILRWKGQRGRKHLLARLAAVRASCQPAARKSWNSRRSVLDGTRPLPAWEAPDSMGKVGP